MCDQTQQLPSFLGQALMHDDQFYFSSFELLSRSVVTGRQSTILTDGMKGCSSTVVTPERHEGTRCPETRYNSSLIKPGQTTIMAKQVTTAFLSGPP